MNDPSVRRTRQKSKPLEKCSKAFRDALRARRSEAAERGNLICGTCLGEASPALFRLASQCIECERSKGRRFAALKREERAAYRKKYTERPEVKTRLRDKNREWMRANYRKPEKRPAILATISGYNKRVATDPVLSMHKRARSLALYAKRTGKLETKPSEKCGARKAQMHHEDYAAPLKVTWLCSRCHGLEHRS